MIQSLQIVCFRSLPFRNYFSSLPHNLRFLDRSQSPACCTMYSLSPTDSGVFVIRAFLSVKTVTSSSCRMCFCLVACWINSITYRATTDSTTHLFSVSVHLELKIEIGTFLQDRTPPLEDTLH